MFAEEVIFSLTTDKVSEIPQQESRMRRGLVAVYLRCMHINAMENEAASNMMIIAGKQLEVGLKDSIISAISTLGGIHAPIEKTFDFIESGEIDGDCEDKVFGFGNSFIKGKEDPNLVPYFKALREANSKLWNRINKAKNKLHKQGKKLYPNGAMATASLCLTLGIPKEISLIPLLMARIPLWGAIFHKGGLLK